MGKFAVSKRNKSVRPELPNIENQTKQKRQENNFSKAERNLWTRSPQDRKRNEKEKEFFKICSKAKQNF
jgi:hypothetical protein